MAAAVPVGLEALGRSCDQRMAGSNLNDGDCLCLAMLPLLRFDELMPTNTMVVPDNHCHTPALLSMPDAGDSICFSRPMRDLNLARRVALQRVPMRYFTYLFNRNGIANLENRAGEYLDRIWGNRLRNVEAGDRIYLVGVNRGRVQLIGRFDASENLRVCGEILGRSTPIRLDCFLEPAIASRLRFVTKKLAVPPVISDGDIDPQTLRGLRQVTLASAALLDQCLGDVDVSGPFVSNTKRRALSVRQPWAELIMRGIKQIEVRSRPTNIRERVFLYASPIHVDVEIERAVDQRYGIDACSLQRGLLVGTVEVVGCRRLEKGDSDHACFRIVNSSGLYAWRLANPERCVPPLRPHRRAQPVWFYPFS